jgi:hypothetical protein
VVDRPDQAPAATIRPGDHANKGQPAVWIVRRAGTEGAGTVDLTNVVVHAYRNDVVLVSGPPAGELVVTAGVQKMAPGLHVALPGAQPSAAVVSQAK